MNLTQAVEAAGVVGAGGAGFPTHVKLAAEAECFIVNAAECEPLIDTDKFLCRTFADEIVAGVAVIGAHLGAKRLVIALKAKYRDEIAALEDAVGRSGFPIQIFPMGTFYPAGDEQVIVQQVCGVSVPERGIPLDVGVVVDNVGTVLNVYDALQGRPVTDKYLSVTGAVARPSMLQVPVGTPVAQCIQAAQPSSGRFALVLGGPMMGRVLLTGEEIEEAVVTKTTGNLLVLPADHYLARQAQLPMDRIRLRAKSACIQCRMCTDLCPRYQIGHQIRPHLVMRNFWRELGMADEVEFTRSFGDAANCCDCGICEMFACPMQLSPRKVNGYLKGKLRERGIQPARNQKPAARPEIDFRRVPTHRLTARLGLGEYAGRHAGPLVELAPDEVRIPFRQHIGAPASPVKEAGQHVKRGELLAAAGEGLSANIHASITGRVAEVNRTYARIQREEE